jgi:hypothetical protein
LRARECWAASAAASDRGWNSKEVMDRATRRVENLLAATVLAVLLGCGALLWAAAVRLHLEAAVRGPGPRGDWNSALPPLKPVPAAQGQCGVKLCCSCGWPSTHPVSATPHRQRPT